MSAGRARGEASSGRTISPSARRTSGSELCPAATCLTAQDRLLGLRAEWREEAFDACARALTEYERVRGDAPSVVPQEDG